MSRKLSGNKDQSVHISQVLHEDPQSKDKAGARRLSVLSTVTVIHLSYPLPSDDVSTASAGGSVTC